MGDSWIDNDLQIVGAFPLPSCGTTRGPYNGESMNLFISFLLLFAGTQHKEIDYASIFATKNDKWMGGASVCLWRVVLPTDHVIAHRTLPCGTTVFIYNPKTRLSTTAVVGDHGPYGACLDSGWRKGTPCRHWTVKKRESDPGVWRGGFDFTPSVAKAIGQVGIELVEVSTIQILPKMHFVEKTTRPSS